MEIIVPHGVDVVSAPRRRAYEDRILRLVLTDDIRSPTGRRATDAGRDLAQHLEGLRQILADAGLALVIAVQLVPSTEDCHWYLTLLPMPKEKTRVVAALFLTASMICMSLPSITTLRMTSGPLPIRFTPLNGAVSLPSSIK